MPALEHVRESLPGVEIEIRTTAFDAAIESAVVDLAIRFLHDHDNDSRLGVPGWSAVCTPEYFEELHRPALVRDLRNAVLAHETIFNFWPACLDAGGGGAHTDVRYVALGDALGTLGAALSGHAVALLPREVTTDLRRRGALISIGGADVEPDAAFFAIPTQTGERKEVVSRIMAELKAALQ